MSALQGLILIDFSEVNGRIYQEVENNNWQILFKKSYTIREEDNIVEKVTLLLDELQTFVIDEWSIYSQINNVKIQTEISKAIGLEIHELSKQTEHELLFAALISKITGSIDFNT